MTEPSSSQFIGQLTAGSTALRLAMRPYFDSEAYAPGLDYVDAGMLATAVADLGSADPEGLGDFFLRLEEVLVDPDASKRKVAVVGLLESLQSQLMNRGEPLGPWVDRLGPVATRYWDVVNDMWRGQITPAEFNRIVEG